MGDLHHRRGAIHHCKTKLSHLTSIGQLSCLAGSPRVMVLSVVSVIALAVLGAALVAGGWFIVALAATVRVVAGLISAITALGQAIDALHD